MLRVCDNTRSKSIGRRTLFSRAESLFITNTGLVILVIVVLFCDPYQWGLKIVRYAGVIGITLMSFGFVYFDDTHGSRL